MMYNLKNSSRRGFTTTSEQRNERTSSFPASVGGAKLSPRGFTLVETLVAIAIITIAIVGPYQAVEKALLASYSARDSLIATSLAEEGIEYARSLRDANYLYNASAGTPRSWLYGLDGTGGSTNCMAANGCTVDPTQNGVAVCSSTCTPLNITITGSTNPGVYNQLSASATNISTRFTRKLTVAAVSGSDHEVRVTVVVSWITSGVPYSTTLSDILDNWL